MNITAEQELAAARAARDCRAFSPDEEDERVSDHDRSCLNCRYRRFIPDGFTCLKK